MKTYKITIFRTVSQEITLEIDAKNSDDALNQAIDEAHDADEGYVESEKVVSIMPVNPGSVELLNSDEDEDEEVWDDDEEGEYEDEEDGST